MAGLAPWHDFAILIGTAFATLIGLLFVAASVGTSVFSPERQYALRVFLSPSVVHFSAGLAIALIVVAPLPSALVVSVLVMATALFGVSYAGVTIWRMVHHHLIENLDVADRLWYGIIPAITYVVMIAAGITLFREQDAGVPLLAATLVLLLVAGVRNAWDITTWVVLRHQ